MQRSASGMSIRGKKSLQNLSGTVVKYVQPLIHPMEARLPRCRPTAMCVYGIRRPANNGFNSRRHRGRGHSEFRSRRNAVGHRRPGERQGRVLGPSDRKTITGARFRREKDSPIWVHARWNATRRCWIDFPSMWTSRPVTDNVHVWETATGEHLRQFEFSAPTTESMMLLPGNRSVVLGAAYSANSNAVQVRDLQTGEPLALLHGHEASVYRLAYSHGVLASASRDKTIRLWEPETFKQIGKLEGHEDEVKSIAFSPDGQWLASCDLAGSVRLWNVKSQLQALQFPQQEYGMLSVSFSPDGKRVVSSLKNGTSLVWDVSEQLAAADRK